MCVTICFVRIDASIDGIWIKSYLCKSFFFFLNEWTHNLCDYLTSKVITSVFFVFCFFFFFFFGSSKKMYDLINHEPTDLPWSYIGFRLWQHFLLCQWHLGFKSPLPYCDSRETHKIARKINNKLVYNWSPNGHLIFMESQAQNSQCIANKG